MRTRGMSRMISEAVLWKAAFALCGSQPVRASDPHSMESRDSPARSRLPFSHVYPLGVAVLQHTRSYVEHHGLFAILNEDEIEI